MMNQTMKWAALVGVLILSAVGLVGCDQSVSDKDVLNNQISLAEVQKLWAKRSGQSLLLIDAEMPKTFQEKHIPGAVNMPWTDFAEDNKKKSELDPRITAYDEIIVYGRNRAPGPVWAATKRMLYSGYSVQAFLGGLEEWQAAGLPVESGPGKKWSEEPRGQLK